MLTDKEIIELEELLELEEIDNARINFYAFCKYLYPNMFTPGKPHAKLIADYMQQVEEGTIKKLMISLPPRGMKSFMTSLLCAWALGRHPDGTIMRNAYGAELAERFSYDVRQMIRSDKYLKVFPHIKLKQDKKAVNDWALETSRQSAYFCSGVGGAITGKGCNLLAILDDPIKNIEEALSENVLEKIWQWYTSTHLSRMETGCPEIQIATRWSNSDVIGRLLSQEGDEWVKIVIPALDKDGKSFCEEIKTTEEYLKTKDITDEFIWEAEYMQSPIEAKGLLYPINELNRFSLSELEGKTPDTVLGYCDTADEGTDFLCSPMAKIFGEKVYITDVVFTQEPIEVTEALVAAQIVENNPRTFRFESNSGGKAFAKNVENLIRQKGCRTYISKIPNAINKETRILFSSGQIKKNFYFRNDYKPGSDYDKYMRQLTSYVRMGKNKHDDAPDATTGLNEMITKPTVSALPKLF
jgi:predicted phage terminase large subunit-like protein